MDRVLGLEWTGSLPAKRQEGLESRWIHGRVCEQCTRVDTNRGPGRWALHADGPGQEHPGYDPAPYRREAP